MLRILHITPSYLPAVRYGGPIWSVHGLAKAQAKLGHHVEVYTTNINGPGVSEVPIGLRVDIDGVGVSYFGSPKLQRLFYAPAMATTLKENIKNFDVVHTHSVFLWPTSAGAKAARRAKVPYVLSPRGMLWKEVIEERSKWIKRSWIFLFEKANVGKAAAIHVTARLEADKMAEIGLKAPHLINLPNAVDDVPPYNLKNISADVASTIGEGDYLLSLGRLSWKKNNLALIRAMADVTHIRAVIAGNEEDGHAAELAAEIKKLDLTERVSLLPRQISGDDKEALFAKCRAFILPSFSENFGNTVVEAMLRKKPVIVSRAAGAMELVERHQCGLTCEPEAGRLAAAISTLLNDTDEAQRMAKRGALAAKEKYNWTNIAKEMCRSYKSLL